MNRHALEVGMAGHPGVRLRQAIDASMQGLLAADGRLPDAAPGLVDVKACNQLLHQNLAGLPLPEG